MNLPPIRPPSSCGAFSTPGYEEFPEATDHHHDSRYLSIDNVDCVMRRAAARIVGTPPTSVCVDCNTIVGYAVAKNDSELITLQIVGEVDPGPGPYPAPTVTSVSVTGEDILVLWGPRNNEASISLQAIADAIAADPVANEMIRIAICDEDQMISFNSELIVALVSFPLHTHFSSDITDASTGGLGDADVGLLARFGAQGSLKSSVNFTAVSLNTQEQVSLHADNVAGNSSITYSSSTFGARSMSIKFPALGADREILIPDKTGTFSVLLQFNNEANAIVGGIGVGDVWWDTTFKKAKVRANPSSSGGFGSSDAGKTTLFRGDGSLCSTNSLRVQNATGSIAFNINVPGGGPGLWSAFLPPSTGKILLAGTEFADASAALLGGLPGEAYWDAALGRSMTVPNLPPSSFSGAEVPTPAAPPADNWIMYAEDNGSGKTRLMVRFATGAPVQIAIEP